MPSCFAFLPHVRMQNGQELRVGPFVLWRNSKDEWTKRFGVDNTAFFEMYRDERGAPVGEKASILSRPDYSDASYEEFRAAVYCLSTAIWMRGGGPSASDAWVFERWCVDVPTPRDLGFNRYAKFSVNFTSADVDRIYPTPYTHRIDINPYSDQQAVDFFSGEMAKPRDKSMLTAFSHFHLARFDTPYFTSPGDAVEAMWSGFESLLEIDQFGPVPPPAPRNRCERLLRRVRKLLQTEEKERLRVGKDEKLHRSLRAEFTKYEASWRPELWTGIESWTKQFYKERNHHSHGSRSDLVTTKLEPYGLSAFEIALHIARAVLRLRLLGDNFLFVGQIAEEVSSLFLFAPVIKRVAQLRQHDRKAWFPGTGTDGAKLSANDVDDIHRDLLDLVNLRLDSRQFRNAAHITKTLKTMALVLSSWVKDLQNHPPSNIDLSPVAQVPGSIQAGATAQKSDDEIVTDLGQTLLGWSAADVDAYGQGALTEPRLLLRSKIPIWLWVDAYIKLTEVWLGYRLR